eukprot:6186703-Pleurochrysis_carterae.AAC.1
MRPGLLLERQKGDSCSRSEPRTDECAVSPVSSAQVRRLRAERALAEKQLQRERAALQAESERASLLRSEQTSAAESLSLEQQALDEARGRVEALSAEAAALAAQVESASGEIGPTERLLAEHAALKRAQADFKKECAAELKRLQQERRRQTEESTDEADVSDQEAELSRLLEAESARLIALKQQLAQRSREAGALQRRVDERPSRAELMQFERRYRELYRQLASKSEETKKYFSSFNALEEERGYLHKEVSLINSIHDNFAKAGAAPKDKARARVVASAAARSACFASTWHAYSSNHWVLARSGAGHCRLGRQSTRHVYACPPL